MQRHVIVVLLVVSIMSSTMLVGCSVTDILMGSSNPLFGIAIIPIQMLGAFLLDQFVGPLLGDPAGDLGGGSGSGGGGGGGSAAIDD